MVLCPQTKKRRPTTQRCELLRNLMFRVLQIDPVKASAKWRCCPRRFQQTGNVPTMILLQLPICCLLPKVRRRRQAMQAQEQLVVPDQANFRVVQVESKDLRRGRMARVEEQSAFFKRVLVTLLAQHSICLPAPGFFTTSNSFCSAPSSASAVGGDEPQPWRRECSSDMRRLSLPIFRCLSLLPQPQFNPEEFLRHECQSDLVDRPAYALGDTVCCTLSNAIPQVPTRLSQVGCI